GLLGVRVLGVGRLLLGESDAAEDDREREERRRRKLRDRRRTAAAVGLEQTAGFLGAEERHETIAGALGERLGLGREADRARDGSDGGDRGLALGAARQVLLERRSLVGVERAESVGGRELELGVTHERPPGSTKRASFSRRV